MLYISFHNNFIIFMLRHLFACFLFHNYFQGIPQLWSVNRNTHLFFGCSHIKLLEISSLSSVHMTMLMYTHILNIKLLEIFSLSSVHMTILMYTHILNIKLLEMSSLSSVHMTILMYSHILNIYGSKFLLTLCILKPVLYFRKSNSFSAL